MRSEGGRWRRVGSVGSKESFDPIQQPTPVRQPLTSPVFISSGYCLRSTRYFSRPSTIRSIEAFGCAEHSRFAWSVRSNGNDEEQQRPRGQERCAVATHASSARGDAEECDRAHLRERVLEPQGRRERGARVQGGFPSGPCVLAWPESTDHRYCIKSAALRFAHRVEFEARGFGDWLGLLEADDETKSGRSKTVASESNGVRCSNRLSKGINL